MAKVATDRKQLNTQMANIICDLCSGFYLKQYFSQQSYLFVGNTGKEDKNSKFVYNINIISYWSNVSTEPGTLQKYYSTFQIKLAIL